MTSLSALLLSITGLLLLGCLNAGAAEPLPLRSIAKGAFSGIQEPTEKLIKDNAAWEKIWAAHATSSQPQEQIPKIDFAKEMVIVVTMGRQRTGGYAIEVTEARPAAGRLQIVVARRTPPPDAMTIQALTAPFHFVAVPKRDMKPLFMKASKTDG